MNHYKKWLYQRIAAEMVEVLQDRHFDAYYAEDIQVAKEMLINLIPKGSSVTITGSETLAKMGLADEFRNGEYKFFDRYQDIPFSQIIEIMRQSMLADFFVTGTNAITRNGELVNIDCIGNRTAGMIFGPKRVIIAVGANKVVDTLDDAMKRLKYIAPMNAKRTNHNTPCKETGRCMDCNEKGRLCNNMTVIYNGLKFEGRISVIMIADEIGF